RAAGDMSCEDGGDPDRARAEDGEAASGRDRKAVEHGAGARLDAATEGRRDLEWDRRVELDDVSFPRHRVGRKARLAEEVRVDVAEGRGAILRPARGEVVLEEGMAVRGFAALAGAAPAARVEGQADAVAGHDLRHRRA